MCCVNTNASFLQLSPGRPILFAAQSPYGSCRSPFRRHSLFTKRQSGLVPRALVVRLLLTYRPPPPSYGGSVRSPSRFCIDSIFTSPPRRQFLIHFRFLSYRFPLSSSRAAANDLTVEPSVQQTTKGGLSLAIALPMRPRSLTPSRQRSHFSLLLRR